MHSIWLIAQRELKARLFSRSFVLMAMVGPLIILIGTYLLFAISGSEKSQYKVLIMDPQEIMDNCLLPQQDGLFAFDFINAFVDYETFAHNEKFQTYDLSVWINEKVFTNKTVIISYRERPSEQVFRRLGFQIERRLEELMVKEFTDLSIQKFREIKQPLIFAYKNTYDPKSEVAYMAGWVGYFFGVVILLFIFLFGMTILRSVVSDKANRVVEVILSAVKPHQLLSGKIVGIGVAALFQFVLWSLLIGIGLYLFRQNFFPDIFDPAVVATQFSADVAEESKNMVNLEVYNAYVDLVYRQVHFLNMIVFFLLFFIGGFMFYGALFAAIGAAMGTESDGQQFIIPIVLVLLLVFSSGYYSIYYPEHLAVKIAAFLPFSSPVTMMVKLGYGFSPGTSWQLFFALFILYVSAILLLLLAGRVYSNGILSFGHRLSIRKLWRFIKQ
jgi:ABC-2 type transport system permease protein